jgi:hypothetical protein
MSDPTDDPTTLCDLMANIEKHCASIIVRDFVKGRARRVFCRLLGDADTYAQKRGGRGSVWI